MNCTDRFGMAFLTLKGNRIMGNRTVKAPLIAKWLLAQFSDYEQSFYCHGDFQEELQDIAESHGKISAVLWYWGQALFALFSHFLLISRWSLVMIQNYIRMVFRLIKREKIYFLINMFGLSIGLMCSLFIFIWVENELSFDRYYTHATHIYRVVDYSMLPSGERNYSTPTPPILAPHLKSEYPEVTHATRLFTPNLNLGTNIKRFIEDVAMVDIDFLEMFNLEFIHGDLTTAFPDIHSIVITQSLAEKLFETLDPVGQVIQIEGATDVTIRAVVRDLPQNMHLNYLDLKAFVPIGLLNVWGRSIQTWRDHSFKTYIQLRPDAHAVEFEAKISDIYKNHIPDSQDTVILQPVTRIHLYDFGGGGLITYIYIMSGMALFILIIACINYMNLATARSKRRALEIGMRRVVGANRRQLIRQFYIESFTVSFMAMGLAISLGYLCFPVFNQIVGESLSLSMSPFIVLVFWGVFLFTGLLAGSYPAFHLSRFRMTDILKGKRIGGGRSFRRILVVAQFIMSVFLIAGSGLVYKQVQYMRTRPLGFEKENIICMTLTRGIEQEYEAVYNELIQIPGIEAICRMNTTMDSWESSTSFRNFHWSGKLSDHDQMKLAIMGTDEYFPETFRVSLAAGRYFESVRGDATNPGIILNQSAVRTMGLENPLEAELTFNDRRLAITGIIEDFHYSSLHDKIEPLMLLMNWGIDTISMRISNENIPAILSAIEETIRNFVPGYTLDYEFLDDRLDNLYRAESQMESIAGVMTILAIIISCLGLMGLTVFTAEQKTNEIGIRKVLGSGVGSIIILLVKDFVKWIILANLIALPIAWIAGSKWLQNFHYRITLGPDLFLIAGAATLILALLTVLTQTVKSALANPIDSIRCE